jgi:hypothetical protein
MPDQVWETGNTKSTENTEGKRGQKKGNREVQREIPKLEFKYPQ